MLIRRKILDRIVSGEIDLAFRTWKRPTVKSGGQLRTVVGELAIDDVAVVSLASLSDDDARRAGYDSLAGLKSDLMRFPGGDLYRIRLHFHGVDRREVLRDDDDISDDECARILEQIEAFDRNMPAAGFSLGLLGWIEEWPERRAQDLADQIKMEKPKLKSRIRKLKELGLTESMDIGYRLSPRGTRLLDFARSRGVAMGLLQT